MSVFVSFKCACALTATHDPMEGAVVGNDLMLPLLPLPLNTVAVVLSVIF